MIDKKTIQKVANLARLNLSDSEIEEMTLHLSKALKHFQKISEISTTGVEPMVTPVEIMPTLREDIAENIYTTEEMTSNAPAKVGHLFKVPPVVG